MVDRLVAVNDADYRLPDPVLGALAADVSDGSTEIGAAILDRQQSDLASVNVKNFGAVPLDQNAGEGQNVAIQAAIDAVAAAGGGTVIVDDDYWIKAHDPAAPPGNFLGDYGGIALKDNVHLKMTGTGALRALTSPESRYVIVRVYNKKNVTISGGRVIGERDSHVGSAGEWGYNIAITAGENITVQGVTTSKAWGDGINIQRYNPGGGNPIVVPKNVQILDVISDGNRRQGMSIEACDGLKVVGGSYINTSGTLPQAGIDIEPVDNTTMCRGIVIQNANLSNNARWGLAVFMNGTTDVLVDNCVFDGNLEVTQMHVQTLNRDVAVQNCTFRNSNTYCIITQGGANRKYLNNAFDKRLLFSMHPDGSSICTDVQVKGNTFSYSAATVTAALLEIHQYTKDVVIEGNTFEYTGGTRGNGIWVRFYPTTSGTLDRIQIKDNKLRNCAVGILTGVVSDVNLFDNRIEATSDYAIRMTPSNCTIKENRIFGANLVSNFSAILIETGGANNTLAGNQIFRDPVITVPETRRGDTGISFGASLTNTVVRGTHITNVAARYSGYPTTHTDTYLETTPGSWYVWP